MKYLFCRVFRTLYLPWLLFSSMAFGALPAVESALYEDTVKETQLEVVFFEREGQNLVPSCRVPVTDYPEMEQVDLPFSFLHELSEPKGHEVSLEEGLESGNESLARFDLEPCAPDLSARLAERAEHFQLYPQVAVAMLPALGSALARGSVLLSKIPKRSVVGTGVIGSVNVASCFLAGGMVGLGVYTHITEEQAKIRALNAERLDWGWVNYAPTSGQILAGGGATAGSALGAVQTHAYLPAFMKNRRSLKNQVFHRTLVGASAAVGIVCSAAGGAVGYFSAYAQKAESALERSQEALSEFFRALPEAYHQTVEQEIKSRENLTTAHETIDRLTSEIKAGIIAQETLEKQLAEKQAELANTQSLLEQSQVELTQAQNELKEAEGTRDELSQALQKEYHRSVEQERRAREDLSKAHQTIDRLTSDIKAGIIAQEALKTQVAEKQAELVNTQSLLEQSQVELTQAQNELKEAEETRDELSHALQEEYRQSVEQRIEDSPSP